MMKLSGPEKQAILILEVGDFLSSIVNAWIDDAADDAHPVFHAHDASAFQSIVEKEKHGIALIIAADDTAPYDTLEILGAYSGEPWFAGALSLVIAKGDDPERAKKAYAIGIQDYYSLSAVSFAGHEEFLRRCIAHEIRMTESFQHLQASASRDGLTGLYNHAVAEDIITRTLRHNPGQEFLFAILDIDYFKQANDVRGHEFGDAVLLEESARIQEILGEQSLAIRYGGDEFVLMIPLSCDPSEIAQAIYKKTHFTLGDYQVTNSIGISTTLSCDREWACLFRQADQALYAAKANGRNQYSIYTEKSSHPLDGAQAEIRNEALNIGAGSIIHSLVNGCSMVYHLDLNKLAVSRLGRVASGAYGWCEPIEYIPFIDGLLEAVEDKGRLRFSEFINPNTLAARLKTTETLVYSYTGADARAYRAEYLAGDRDRREQVVNALLLLREASPSEGGNAALHDEVTAIERCLASSLTHAYNAIWVIHPTTLARELVSIQTDISRHRRINRLFEGGNYWEETQGYIRLYVNETDRESLLKALEPEVLLREVQDRGIYTLYFHRRIDGMTYRCEYSFVSAMYREEKVILQLYRRLT